MFHFFRPAIISLAIILTDLLDSSDQSVNVGEIVEYTGVVGRFLLSEKALVLALFIFVYLKLSDYGFCSTSIVIIF